MHESLLSDVKVSLDKASNDGEASSISGWCFSYSKSPIQEIRLSQNNKTFPGQHGFVREDVQKHYGTVMATDKQSLEAIDVVRSSMLHSGFSIKINEKVKPSGDINIEVLKTGSSQWEKIYKIEGGVKGGLLQEGEGEDKREDEGEGGGEGVLKISSTLNTDVVIIDNVYEDPDAVRKFALSCEFQQNDQYHKGQRSVKKFITDDLKILFEKALDKKITSWESQPHNGVFQFCVAQDSLVYHVDAQSHAAMIFLHPNAPAACGTTLYGSKSTGLRASPTESDSERLGVSRGKLNYQIFKNNFYDKSGLEVVDVVGNVYNRLFIFNAKSIHAASEYFGDTKENSRLFQIFFFDAV